MVSFHVGGPSRWPYSKASASETADLGFDSRFRSDLFCGSCHTSDFNIGTPVLTLPDTWRCRVSAGTGWPGVRIL